MSTKTGKAGLGGKGDSCSRHGERSQSKAAPTWPHGVRLLPMKETCCYLPQKLSVILSREVFEGSHQFAQIGYITRLIAGLGDINYQAATLSRCHLSYWRCFSRLGCNRLFTSGWFWLVVAHMVAV